MKMFLEFEPQQVNWTYYFIDIKTSKGLGTSSKT